MDKVAGVYPIRATVQEMGANNDDIVPLDAELVKAIVGDDPDPMFVTIEVLNESVSTNGRFYDKATIADIAKQINEKHPDGYAGHLNDAERSHKVPDAETFWLGAVVKEVDGKSRLIAKGYVLPEATRRRSVLKRALAIKRNVAVSIYGTANRVWDAARKAYKLSEYDLESIDWTRPGSEGVRNSGLFMVTAEMNDNGNINPGDDNMDKAKVLKAATADDLRENVSPDVIAEMTNEAVEAAKVEQREVVSEMTAISEKLGEKPLEVIAEMQSKLTGFELDKELTDKVSDGAARKMVKRMVTAEMREDAKLTATEAVDKVLASEDGKAVVAEMTVREPRVTPQTKLPGATSSKFIEKKGN